MKPINEIREVTVKDANEICDIYNYYVLNTAITFETEAISVSEMQDRIQSILDCGLPYYVAVENNHVIGYCYLHSWNNRCAYSSTKEVSIYLDKNVRRQGLGTKLFEHILKNADHKNIHVLVSGICLPNESSVCLHEKFGFKQVSLMKEIGRKFGEWRDVGHWQLIIDNKQELLLKKSKSTEAVETFSKKFNCAQSVLSVFSDDLNISKDDCLKIATPFGSGVAYRQEMCGAVAGALMAIGMKYGMGENGTKNQKSYTYDIVTHFISEFKKQHGSICCKYLLDGIDMSTPEGYSKVCELNIFRTHCSEYVRSAVQICEKILSHK